MQRFSLLFFLVFCTIISNSQYIDQITAIVGNQMLLNSEIDAQYAQYASQNPNNSNEITWCDVFEEILLQKLLVNQADLDSINVNDDEIQQEAQKRIMFFERQLGSIKNIELYFNKPLSDIEQEIKKIVAQQIKAQRMQSRITLDVNVTPAEVKQLFNDIKDKDIPIIPTQVEISQIVVKPEITAEKKDKIRQRLNSFRKRINNGEDFKVLAALYSDDAVSANNGGELGFVNRGDLVPEFERVAFRLKQKEVSEIVETKYGFHIMQLIERRGEQINVRHILIKPVPNSEALLNAKNLADRIINLLNSDSISFSEAITMYSDDESKNNGGLLLNPNTMSTTHTLNDMSDKLRLQIEKLEEEDYTLPSLVEMPDESSAYRILHINKKIAEHKANLSDDFKMINEFAINEKKQRVLMRWIDETINKTYIRINDHKQKCDLKNNWIK